MQPQLTNVAFKNCFQQTLRLGYKIDETSVRLHRVNAGLTNKINSQVPLRAYHKGNAR